jgi:cytidylate kinase
MSKSIKSSKEEAKSIVYYPGMYHKTRPKVYDIVEKAFKDWKKEQDAKGKKKAKKHPVICFSRKIGVGSFEIANILSKKIGFRVIDREILEYLAKRKELDKKMEAFLEEKCPSGIEEMLAKIFGERAFPQTKYSGILFKTIFSLVDIEPVIFVGRGAHLILPRDNVLAVRLICSEEFRLKRLVNKLKIPESSASIKLHHYDLEQKNFFGKVYNLESAPANEFDLVINRDYIEDAKSIAEIIEVAFREKFGDKYIESK